MTWYEWTAVGVAIWCFLAVVSYLGVLMGISSGWPCANPKCKEFLQHADYTSMFCHDCRGVHDPASASQSVRSARTRAAYGDGKWPG